MGNLYHKDIYLPPGVLALTDREVTFKITTHAANEARGDRYGAVVIPDSISFNGEDVVEAAFENKLLQKLVVRKPYDARRDAVYVFNVDGTLKTVWTNLTRDLHSTLDRAKYVSAPVK